MRFGEQQSKHSEPWIPRAKRCQSDELSQLNCFWDYSQFRVESWLNASYCCSVLTRRQHMHTTVQSIVASLNCEPNSSRLSRIGVNSSTPLPRLMFRSTLCIRTPIPRYCYRYYYCDDFSLQYNCTVAAIAPRFALPLVPTAGRSRLHSHSSHLIHTYPAQKTGAALATTLPVWCHERDAILVIAIGDLDVFAWRTSPSDQLGGDLSCPIP